jgi:hypothetical protein
MGPDLRKRGTERPRQGAGSGPSRWLAAQSALTSALNPVGRWSVRRSPPVNQPSRVALTLRASRPGIGAVAVGRPGAATTADTLDP